MKLQEGQVWKQGDTYLRIVHWERMAIGYKAMKDLRSKEGTMHQVTKKEFCRLLKGAVLVGDAELRALKGEPEESSGRENPSNQG